MAHAKLSPSGAHRWMACPGSVVLEAAYPDDSSIYAAEGTLAHEIASESLLNDTYTPVYLGTKHTVDGFDFTVGQDMIDHVLDYMKLVRELSQGKTLYVESKVPIGHLTGEEGATGTSDVVIVDVAGRNLSIVDLKYGVGVAVDATNNPQLMMYALGALEMYGVLCDFDTVSMYIHMPRLNYVGECHMTTEDLLKFADQVREAAGHVQLGQSLDMSDPTDDLVKGFFTPGEKQCRFCKAKATCPALRAEMTEVVGGSAAATLDEFEAFLPEVPDMQTGDNYLSIAMAKVGLVEDWCKAVRAEVERRLLAGQKIDGFKLVEGRKGNRKWKDEAEVEALFKSFRLRQDEIYDMSLISPTKAEKMFKSNPKRWEKVEALTSRSDGKPSVAFASDKRSELTVQSVADDFSDLIKTAN
jgi:hypothetical protein